MDKIIIDINDINIPNIFKETPPNKNKYVKNLNYYNKFHKFRHSTIINKGKVLVDGYCNYLICKCKGIEKIECFIDKSAYIKGNKIKFKQAPAKRRQITKNMRIRVYLKNNGICTKCGRILQLADSKRDDYATVDHIKPVSKGGKSSFNNYQLMCKKCNRLKGDSY